MALKSFNDGSGKKDTAAISLAGVAALEPLWPEFDKDWEGLLKKHNIPCFHMTDAIALARQFSRAKGWNHDKVMGLVKEVTRLLHKHRKLGMQFICSTVLRADYDKLKRETPTLRPMAAICVNYTVGGLIVPPGEDVILYFDRNEQFLHQVNRVWLRLKKRRAKGWARQTKNIIPVDSSHYAIQAADFIAWSRNRQQTHGDYSHLDLDAFVLSNGRCLLYDYKRLVERYGNDKWA